MSIFLLILITSTQGCGSKDKEKIEPEPTLPDPTEDQNEFFYKLSSETSVEFMEFFKGDKVKDLNDTDIKDQFGNRVDYFQPDSLHITEDSLFVNKRKGASEVYQIKWEDNNLFIRSNQNSEWSFWAKRDLDSTISLQIAYFKKAVKNNQHTYLTTGQQYSLSDYQDVLQSSEEKNSSMVWLLRNSVFIPVKK